LECEICGKKIIGSPNRVMISGAKLTVCINCAKLSTATWTPSSKTYQSSKRIGHASFKTKRRRNKIKTPSGLDLELIEGYGNLIRNARRRQDLSHEDLGKKIGEKVSVLQKIETEKMVPDQRLSRKLEHTLKIRLLKPLDDIRAQNDSIIKPIKLTLGDVVTIKRLEKNEEEK
jgi:putative transcription factor